MNNIVLCGFMGCGKSTAGKNIARKTGKKYVDMDIYIEQKAGMRVSEIFEKFGEQGFRDMEHEACKELSESTDLIIATGGGALTFERNVNVFKGKDTIVLLDVPLGVIRYRLRNDKKRPLLQRPDKDEAMKALYETRLPLYRRAADVTVKGKPSPMHTAYAIMDALHLTPVEDKKASQEEQNA